MIIDFKFKNFMSFADECYFTMSANKDSKHEDQLINIGKERFSKARIIYGANASGKTSFIDAIYFIHSFVLMSNVLVANNAINVRPFKFRENYLDIPSEFDITFMKNNLKHRYRFSCTRSKVIDEKLEIYYSAKPTTIFERTNTTEYKFTSDTKILNELKEKNLHNKLFLVTSATWNYERTKDAVDFFISDICIASNIGEFWQDYMDTIVSNNLIEDYKSFCLQLLYNADLSISDFNIKYDKLTNNSEHAKTIMSTLLKNIPSANEQDIANALNTKNIYSFKTIHTVEEKQYILSLNEESLGTRQLFMLAPLLYTVFKKGSTIFIDEIERGLHPLLVEYIIRLFKDSNINKNNAQLIANTHNTNLLTQELFRRDEIWFTERNADTGSTTMFPLSDFSPRNNENLEKSYLLGRFGAIPFIKET